MPIMKKVTVNGSNGNIVPQIGFVRRGECALAKRSRGSTLHLIIFTPSNGSTWPQTDLPFWFISNRSAKRIPLVASDAQGLGGARREIASVHRHVMRSLDTLVSEVQNVLLRSKSSSFATRSLSLSRQQIGAAPQTCLLDDRLRSRNRTERLF